MAFKRVSRARKRDLEQPDRITSFLNELLEFAQQYKVHLSVIMGIIVAIAIGVAGSIYFTNKAEKRASVLLSRALNKYQSLADSKGPGQAYLDVVDDFNRIIREYSGKDGGKLAKLMFANICYDSGRFDTAITLYKQSLLNFDDRPFIKNRILNGLGYAYEAQKDYQAAADYYQRIVAAPDDSMRDETLFKLAGVYAAMGNYPERLKVLKKIISDHKDSIYLEIVKEYLAGYAGQP